jgi:hypothetical protein
MIGIGWFHLGSFAQQEASFSEIAAFDSRNAGV